MPSNSDLIELYGHFGPWTLQHSALVQKCPDSLDSKQFGPKTFGTSA